MGVPFWKGSERVPALDDLPPLARAVTAKIALSVIFEDHAAYAPLHAAARLTNFAATMYEEARELLGDPSDFEPSQVIDAATRLEVAVSSLHRAADHVEAVRQKLGLLPGFELRATTPATRGDKPIAISRIEKKMLGNLDGLRDLRNALEHADERMLADKRGETFLVPREHGMSLDEDALLYADFVKTAYGIVTLVDAILDAGSAE